MNVVLKAGTTYFGVVFFVAFMLGSIRVLLLVPRLGEIVSVSLEAPVILAVSWIASRWTSQKFNLTSEVLPRLLMGAVAFVQLMSAELGLSILVFGRPIEEFFAAYWSAQGVIGLAAEIAFAVIPMIQRTER